MSLQAISDKTRILTALRAAGNDGITVVDFLLPDVTDGAKPITRVAARVKDLRDEGHPIVTDGRRNRCAVYKLDESAAPPVRADSPQRPAAEQAAGMLFDMPARVRGAYDEENEAA